MNERAEWVSMLNSDVPHIPSLIIKCLLRWQQEKGEGGIEKEERERRDCREVKKDAVGNDEAVFGQ